ncbi:MAG: hypothetical protein JW891_18565 [Candidatus Lokiarchaeota archaeon]|nr:hypothetical protein [Candidatus Lokiarchaeota archaeon]
MSYLNGLGRIVLQGVTKDWLRWYYNSEPRLRLVHGQEPDARGVYREIGGFTQEESHRDCRKAQDH